MLGNKYNMQETSSSILTDTLVSKIKKSV